MTNILIFGYNKWYIHRPCNNIALELSQYHRIVFVECQDRYTDYGLKKFYSYIRAFYNKTPQSIKANLYIWNPPPMLPLEWVKKLAGSIFNIVIILKLSKYIEKMYLKKALKEISFMPNKIFIFDSPDLH